MGIYVYTVKHDAGFAPNPFHGYCTLAYCKPRIRERAKVGDWLVGISSASQGKRLIYAMQVWEALSFAEYFLDERFLKKKPSGDQTGPMREQCGDNCYRALKGGGSKQLPSFHYDFDSGREDAWQKEHDLGGKNVLVAKRFSYFGSNAVVVPSTLDFMMPARFYRSNFVDGQRAAILEFVNSLPRGVRGTPLDWAEDDPSCRVRKPKDRRLPLQRQCR